MGWLNLSCAAPHGATHLENSSVLSRPYPLVTVYLSPMTNRKPNGRPRKYGRRYPWADWFALERFTLRRGRDYDTPTYTMAQQVRNAAGPRRHNVRVSILIDPDREALTVSVLPPPSAKRK